MPASLERAAEHPVRPERGEQPDPRDRRRQDQRQLDQRDHDRAARETTASRAARRPACPTTTIIASAISVVSQASHKRVDARRIVEAREQLARSDVDEDRDDRQHRNASATRERDASSSGGEPAAPLTAAARSPRASSACAPAPAQQAVDELLRLLGCFAPFTTATP